MKARRVIIARMVGFPCTFEGCDRVCKRREHLNSHLLTHTGERPFVCSECAKTFTMKVSLDRHFRAIHTDERPHSCPFEGCDKRFAVLGDAKKHYTRCHTEERPFVCSYPGCTMAFCRGSDLELHVRTHTGERPYACAFPGCKQAFSCHANLRKHEMIHTDQRPYPCSVETCAAAFRTKKNLETHMRVHTGERPFVCEDCGYGFAQKGNYDNHRRVHTGERPYVCQEPECGAAFANSGNLRKHTRALHTQEGQQRQKKAEQRIARCLDAAGISYKREHVVDFTCSGTQGARFARVDFVIVAHGRVVMLEVDENQHGLVSCDVARMGRILESLALGGNTLPVTFVRYNPDAFRVDGVRQKVPKKQREARLVGLLRDPESCVYDAGRPVAILYMYYDTVEGRAVVVGEEEFLTLKDLVLTESIMD